MSDIDTLALSTYRQNLRGTKLSVDAKDWGYVIRAGHTAPMDVLIGQILAFFFGVCFVTAGLGLLLLPGLFVADEAGPMRLGAAGLFGAGAAYLLWFASRGSQTEVHINLESREMTEVIGNRVGKPTLLDRFAFDDIGGVFVEASAGRSPAQLVVGYRGSMVLVAEGTVEELTPLRAQLARDLMGPVDMTRPVARIAKKSRRPSADSAAA
ncbi:hypothetical protein [Yoonia litorea]|uniref:Uncharacterized protein n=1 Tax=Yoonia litorea TaxID=1123755 RepID=A0A1I6LWL9_9RHOB|nr:hypothetical protein [Yoonia litorea]SFS07810.1 hypothetical protein SAMN05444714_0966 [Yoonia litorea]